MPTPLRLLSPVALLALAVLSGAACDDKPAPKTPRGPHARARARAAKPIKRAMDFPLHVDKGPFFAAGCFATEDETNLDCSSAEFVHRFGCAPIVRVDNLLGGIASPVSVGMCNVMDQSPEPTLVRVGCSQPLVRKFVVWDGDHFKLLEDAEEFRERFSPVKTTDAALGFAIALTRDTRPLFELEFDDEGDVAPDVMPSNVVARPNGWVVRLFEREACGCEHGDYAEDLMVTPSGEVARLTRTLVHVDPRLRGVCEK